MSLAHSAQIIEEETETGVTSRGGNASKRKRDGEEEDDAVEVLSASGGSSEAGVAVSAVASGMPLGGDDDDDEVCVLGTFFNGDAVESGDQAGEEPAAGIEGIICNPTPASYSTPLYCYLTCDFFCFHLMFAHFYSRASQESSFVILMHQRRRLYVGCVYRCNVWCG